MRQAYLSTFLGVVSVELVMLEVDILQRGDLPGALHLQYISKYRIAPLHHTGLCVFANINCTCMGSLDCLSL